MVTNATNGTQTFYNGYWLSADIGDGYDYEVSLQYTNACGTSGFNTVGTFNCPPGQTESARGTAASRGAGSMTQTATPGSVAWPNPTNGIVTVALPAPATSGTPAAPSRVYMIRVTDVQGVVRKTYSYPGGIDKASVDISNLAAGIYILQIFDNHRWIAKQVVLTK
jgi:hypothetical protein